MKKTVYNGCDRLDSAEAKALLGGRRLGLLTGVSGVTRDLRLSAEVLCEKYSLAALFGAEHGIRGANQDNHVDADHAVDPVTGLPVYNICSLSSTEQAEKAISRVDAVLVDIQDVGVRYYTFQFAMLDAMRYCAKHGKELIVLDRLCPLGGEAFGGQILEEDCTSAIGRVAGQSAYYGMTMGELALWFNEHLSVGARVSVLPCEGWDRSAWYEDTDLPYVPPSPNLPCTDAILTYIALCTFEQTSVSEGRGTTRPFEIFGAPWMDPQKVTDAVGALPPERREAFDGLLLRPLYFKPTFHKYQGELCGGIQLHVRDRSAPKPFAAGLILHALLREMYPKEFTFTEKLCHVAGTRRILKEDFDPIAYLASQKEALAAFGKARARHLIY